MEDKIKKKGIIITAVLYVVATLLFVPITAIFYDGVYSLIIAFAGGLIALAFTSVMHEAGHIYFAKKYGYEVIGISAMGFYYLKPEKKFGFKFLEPLGETDVIPNVEDNLTERYLKIVKGGIYGNLIACTILALLFTLSTLAVAKLRFPKWVVEMFVGSVFSYVIMVINCTAGINEDSDASIVDRLTLSDAEYDGTEKYLTIMENLRKGMSFGDMDGELFEFSSDVSKTVKGALNLFALLREEELGDFSKSALRAKNATETADLTFEYKAELLYYYAVSGNEEGVKKYENAISGLDATDNAVAQRTLIALAKMRGDTNYVQVAKVSAYKLAEKCYLDGEKKYNKLLLDELYK